MFGWFAEPGLTGVGPWFESIGFRPGVVFAGHGFFASNNGVEVPVLYITGAVVVALAGPGIYLLDRLLGLDSRLQQVPGWIVLAVGLLGALGNLVLRRPVAAWLTMQRKGVASGDSKDGSPPCLALPNRHERLPSREDFVTRS